jgi:hypothetical protein
MSSGWPCSPETGMRRPSTNCSASSDPRSSAIAGGYCHTTRTPRRRVRTLYSPSRRPLPVSRVVHGSVPGCMWSPQNSARQAYRRLRQRAAEWPTGVLPVVADPRTTSVIAGTRLDLLAALNRLEHDRPDLVGPIVLRGLAQLEYAEIAEGLGFRSARLRRTSTGAGNGFANFEGVSKLAAPVGGMYFCMCACCAASDLSSSISQRVSHEPIDAMGNSHAAGPSTAQWP